MSRYVLVTLDYPPERGGVARYLGELVKASQGAIEVIVEQDHVLTGPGNVTQRELVRSAWPKWWPMVGIIRASGIGHRAQGLEAHAILVSHVLPVGTAAMIARWFGGAPYVVFCHGLDVRLAAISWRKRWLFNLVCRNAKSVVANSESTAASIRALTGGLQALVLTPGVTSPALLSREAARSTLGVAHDEEVILSIARLVRRKGIDALLEATERLADRERVRIVIVGDGPELADLKQYAMHLKHRVDFIMHASDDDVARWYAAADVFCLPTRENERDVEGFGIVYLEAAAYGLPVIATRSGGVSEAVIDGQTGILVAQDDVAGVARALEQLLSDSGHRERLGTAGRERALREFRWKDRWDTLMQAIERV